MIPVAAAPCPIVLAHRGGGAEAPENTWQAFRHASQIGVTHLETDAQVTKDGLVVLTHDLTLRRTYGVVGQVSDYTSRELLQFRSANGEQMPLLSDVLGEFPNLYFNLDAKTDEVVEPLLQVIAKADAFDRVLLASFSEKRLQQIRSQWDRPDLTTSLGVGAVVRLWGATRTLTSPAVWRVPKRDQHVRAVQVPERKGTVRVVNRRFVDTSHAAGLAVHVWTVNDPAQMARLLDLGVDGIITDYPSRLIDLLKERGQWLVN